MQRIAPRIREAAHHLKQHGYTVIRNFLPSQQCQEAIDEVDRLVDNFEPTAENITIFGGEGGKNHKFSKYFMESSDKVRFFFEPKAWQNDKLTVPKRMSINKIGHALHEHNKIFERITYTQGVGELCQEMGIQEPLVMQSMAILKPPKIGGRVSIHQDSTFLYAEPDTLLGFWMPLQDATLKNGCLWGIPGSHKFPLYCRAKVVDGVNVDEHYHEVDYKDEDFVPIEMEKGSLAVFTGRFLHKSGDNTSEVSRYAYTWHLMDSSSKWSPHNWLQRPSFPKFQRSPS
jgi:phytanoyl-CoA hydroxylase